MALKNLGSGEGSVRVLSCLDLPKVYLFYVSEGEYTMHSWVSLLWFWFTRCTAIYQGRTTGILLTRDNRVVASAFIDIDRSTLSGYIYSVRVRKDMRGRGLGKILMEALLAYAKKLGLNRVYLVVDSENKIAVSLYNKLGFRCTGKMLRMELEL